MLGHLRPKLIVAVACCSIVALTACGSGDSASTGTSSATSSSSKEKRIAFFTDGLDNPYSTTAVDAAKQAAADGGAELDVISANWDANAQIGQVQDALASGKYDALVVESVDGVTLQVSVTCAAEDLVVGLQYSDLRPLQGAVHPAPWATSVVTSTSPVSCSARKRRKRSAAAKHAGVHLGSRERRSRPDGEQGHQGRAGQASRREARRSDRRPGGPGQGLAATQDILQSNPDVDGLLYYVDHMAIPSIKWMQQNNKLGDRKIVTLGGTTQGFDLIKQGIITA
ncbi:MAG: hypothetical protein R2736_17615 [Solirubrobacterales bacterium]